MLSQSQGIGLRLEHRLVLPQKLMMSLFLVNKSPKELESILEDALNDQRANHIAGKGNLMWISPYDGGFNGNTKVSQVEPTYEVDINRDRINIEDLRDYSGVEKILGLFQYEGVERPLANCFSKAVKDQLSWGTEMQRKIVEYVFEKQKEAIESKDTRKLAVLTQDIIGEYIGVIGSTVSKLIKNLIVEVNGQNLQISDLITSNPESIRAKRILLGFARKYGGIDKIPYSDERMTQILARQGINVARRTVNKYKASLADGSLYTGGGLRGVLGNENCELDSEESEENGAEWN